MIPFEKAMMVFCRLSFVTVTLSLTIRPQLGIECLRRSNQQGLGHFGATFGEEVVDWCELNFNAISGCRMSISSAVRTQCTNERDSQTDHGTVTSIAIDKVACQRCRLTMKYMVSRWCSADGCEFVTVRWGHLHTRSLGLRSMQPKQASN